jgi:hypothetical protein
VFSDLALVGMYGQRFPLVTIIAELTKSTSHSSMTSEGKIAVLRSLAHTFSKKILKFDVSPIDEYLTRLGIFPRTRSVTSTVVQLKADLVSLSKTVVNGGGHNGIEIKRQIV